MSSEVPDDRDLQEIFELLDSLSREGQLTYDAERQLREAIIKLRRDQVLGGVAFALALAMSVYEDRGKRFRVRLFWNGLGGSRRVC